MNNPQGNQPPQGGYQPPPVPGAGLPNNRRTENRNDQN
jgi:hypothetical protein